MSFLDNIFHGDNDEILFFIIIFLFLFYGNFFGGKCDDNLGALDEANILFFIILFLLLFLNNDCSSV